jgi:hypothetical protein
MSAYGPIQSGNVGTGMLAPYNASTNASQLTGMKTGGTKKTSSKKMKGGMESSGATPLPTRFYVPDANLDNYPALSGNGIMSAYGPIQSGNVGTGMLAPYNASTNSSQLTGMKTGGSKKTGSKKTGSKKTGSKKLILKKGGKGPIPVLHDDAVVSVQNTVNKGISGFSNFMQKLDESYLKSVEYTKSIKVGNQRLIKGGKKNVKKDSKKDSKKIKKNIKKVIKKVSKKVKKGGSNGSDFALTLNSRGPVNAPDDYWGVPGETWFRQFNKSGDYIPNSKLPLEATPILAGKNDSGIVSGYNPTDKDYQPI